MSHMIIRVKIKKKQLKKLLDKWDDQEVEYAE